MPTQLVNTVAMSTKCAIFDLKSLKTEPNIIVRLINVLKKILRWYGSSVDMNVD